MRWSLVIVMAASTGALADPKPDPCSAQGLGLPKAKPLAAWTPPAGCTASGANTPALLATEADAKAAVTCKDPKTKLGVDFAKSALVVTSRQWSPATVGLLAFDDGKTVTLVSRQRKPCPDDPRPMPTPAITSVFLAAKGARTFAEASCSFEPKCK